MFGLVNRRKRLSAAAGRHIRYEVVLPDGRVKTVSLDARASGQDCLEMVCISAGVQDEADYFGLEYPGSRGEQLWVNSRNRLDRQLPAGGRTRLRLAVKFFVQPHMLVLEETRRLFLLEARRRLLELDEAGKREPATLEQAAALPDYGRHFYPAWDCYRNRRWISVDSQAVCVCGQDRSVLERFPFPRVQKVTKSGRLVYLLLSNPDGSTREVGFRLSSSKAGSGFYRFVTETHSFFRCDTVRAGVSGQKSRDFKTALVSLIFTEADACVDPKFVFDVRRTARQVHDCARRRQFRHCQGAAASAAASVREQPADENSTAALRLRLEALERERSCRVCADADLSVVFVPCGHLAACAECAEKLADCPLCRQPVARRQRCQLPATR